MCSGKKSLSSRTCEVKNYLSALKYFNINVLYISVHFCIIILYIQKAIGGNTSRHIPLSFNVWLTKCFCNTKCCKFAKKKFFQHLKSSCTTAINEPPCEKTSLWGFRPGLTQTGLYSHRIWLDMQQYKITAIEPRHEKQGFYICENPGESAC